MTQILMLLVVVGAVTGLVMLAYLFIRKLWETQQGFWQKRLPPEEERSIVSPDYRPATTKIHWQDRLDNAFEQMIRRTGLGLSPQQALGWIALAGVLVAGALFLWRNDLWLIGVGLVVGMGLPLVVYLIYQTRWRRQMWHQLPDTYYLLARSLRAGLSLEQALENVSQHGSKPLADEFRRGVEQVKLGMTVPVALNRVARRINIPDFDVFVSIVALHRTLGGNLTMLLDRVATTTRDRTLFRGHFRAATALARITGFCLAIGAPLIFLGYSLWQPDFVARFWETTTGTRMFAAACVLEVIGIVWMGFLLRSRY